MSTGNTPPEQPYDPNQPRIADPCPSCGGSTLFIGAGGWLTCSLIGCRQPVMFDAIAAVRREEREACAKEIDGLAFCEECHDCYDDLIRSAPYRRAAKYLRDNAMNEGGSK